MSFSLVFSKRYFVPSSNRYTHIYTPQLYFFTLIPHSHPCQPPPTTPLTSIHLTHVPVRGRGRLRNLQDIARSLHVAKGRGGRRGWKMEGMWRWRKKKEKMTPVVIVVLYIYIHTTGYYLPTYRPTPPPIHSGGGGDGEIQLPAAPLPAPETEQDGKLLVSKKEDTKITKTKRLECDF